MVGRSLQNVVAIGVGAEERRGTKRNVINTEAFLSLAFLENYIPSAL